MLSLSSELSVGSFFGFPEGLSDSFFGGGVGSGFFGLLGPRVGGSLWREVGRFLGGSGSSLSTGVTAPLGIILSLIPSGGISIGPCNNPCDGLLVTKVATICNGALLSS